VGARLDSAHVLVAPGLRTLPATGLRARLGTALAVVAADPRLWLLGAAGFMLRGGIVVLVAPMLVLPTQVEIRLLLGDYLGTSGFTPSFFGLLIGAAIVAAAILVAIVVILARLELALFDAVAANARVDGPARATPASRGALLARLVTVQAWTLIAVIAAALPLAFAIGDSAYAEVIRPTSTAPIYERVLTSVGLPLTAFVVAILVIEALSAVISRRLLAGRDRSVGLRRAAAEALRRSLRSPVRTLSTAVSGWLIAIAALAPVVALIVFAWQPVRRAFLSTVSAADVADPRSLLAAVVLAGTLVVGVAVAGLMSAVRSAIWTVDSVS
jgi:hypothetical protein